MTFQGSVVKEQGVTFGIVIVQRHVIDSPNERAEMIAFGRRAFGAMPIILYDNSRYFGRDDIVKFLSHIDPSRIPWKEYTIA